MLKIHNKIKLKVIRVKNTIINLVKSITIRTKAVLSNNRAEGSVDMTIKILTGVVLGALVLYALYALFGDTVVPLLTQKIKDLFGYSGT